MNFTGCKFTGSLMLHIIKVCFYQLKTCFPHSKLQRGITLTNFSGSLITGNMHNYTHKNFGVVVW